MLNCAKVTIHESQFPESVRLDLLESLRSREVNHKFHYDSLKQTQKWLALHQAYSPARTDPACAAIYQKGFAAAAQRLPPGSVHVIGLGCGGGQKDVALLSRLRESGREVFYTPVDVSVAMVLVARRAALEVVPAGKCFPFVCDFATARDLSSRAGHLLPGLTTTNPTGAPAPARIFTFFGMIPNFEPQWILPRLAALVDLESPAAWDVDPNRRCSLDFGSVGAILVSVMAVLHVVEQCANARQLGGEIPPMAIPVVGSDALRTTAQRGEDLVIGRSLHVAAILCQKRKAACVATSGPSLGRKRPMRAAIARLRGQGGHATAYP
jgi:hypothetical protein